MNLYKEFGAFTHIGQDEFTAGAGAGDKFNEAGAKVLLCAKQEQTNTGLDARCDGAKSTFKGTFLTPITTSGDASGKQQADMKAAIDADPTIDAVFGVGPVIAHDSAAAAKELGRTVTVGGVDLSPDLLKDIAAGDVLFTIDQQQYLQGYISVVALYLNVTNQNTLGGGLPINTGPGFVDQGQRRRRLGTRRRWNSLIQRTLEVAGAARRPPHHADRSDTHVYFGRRLYIHVDLADATLEVRGTHDSDRGTRSGRSRQQRIRRRFRPTSESRIAARCRRWLDLARDRRLHRGRHRVEHSSGAMARRSEANTTLNWLDVAAPTGIMATAVALLMIGGEFDLSSGVMTGATAIQIGLVSRFFMGTGVNIGWAIGSAFLACRSRRLVQRLHGQQDRATQLHRHAGSFFTLG